MISKLKKFFINKQFRFAVYKRFGLYKNISDEKYIKKAFKVLMGKKLNLENPRTFNEKLQWLKLYDRKPIYTTMVDKCEVKKYVADIIGEEYIIPNIGVWNSPQEIDFDELPSRFVLKCNHNSGLGMYICKDKSKLSEKDVKTIRRNLEKGIKQDYYKTNREWPYKNVPRKILAETYLENPSGGLIDYKVHCFNGEPKFILVCSERFGKNGLCEDFVTLSWEKLPFKRPNIRTSETLMERPKELDKVLQLSKVLSKNIPFVRVDFYIVNGKIYFSEMTFFPASGFGLFEPDQWDEIIGDYLTLPNK